MTLFDGCGVALVTPFGSDGNVNFEALEKLLEHVIGGGADALFACGTTGEPSTMSQKEREKSRGQNTGVCGERLQQHRRGRGVFAQVRKSRRGRTARCNAVLQQVHAKRRVSSLQSRIGCGGHTYRCLQRAHENEFQPCAPNSFAARRTQKRESR